MIFSYPLFRTSARGKENVPRTGPVLILSNHQSYVDPIFCQVPIRRPFFFVARSTLYGHWFFGRILATLNTIPIKRGQADLSAMKAIMAKLKEGYAVCLYPEGTRTEDGRISEIKPGFTLLARRTNAQVVPMVIDGAFECWSRDKKFPSFGKVNVRYGQAIPPEEIKKLGDREFSRFITARLRELQGQLRRETGKKPFDYTGFDDEEDAE